MKMICDVPDEVIKCIKDGTWCGSSVAEKMIANGIPLSSSEEPCEDAISRQAVLKIIDGWYDNNRDTENIEDLIVLITYMCSVNPQKPKSEWEHDHEILKAYSDGASAVLESLIEQYEHYLELLDADMKDGSATIVTKTKYAVYTEVVKQLKEVEVQE